MSEWYAFDERWPISDGWRQTAKICQVIMGASGNYKKIPDAEVFMPIVARKPQSLESMFAEVAKLQELRK